MQAKVVSVKNETPDIKCVRLAVNLEFHAGQFITAELKTHEGMESKHFSIASSPFHKGFIEIAKKITDSPFSKAFDTLRDGDIVEIKGPFGHITFQDSKHDIIMLAGGIGITPLRSMLHYANDAQLDKKIILFFSNNRPDEIPFKHEIDQLGKTNPNIRIIHTITQPDEDDLWDGAIGRITQGMLESNIGDPDNYTFYVCGPPEMVDSMKKLLEKMSVDEKNICIERFVGY